MSNHSETCACAQETDEQKYERIAGIIDEYGAQKTNLIQILHMAQGIFGYLPLELQRFIADKLRLSLSEVYGVVTFYSYFSTTPRGKYTIGVCLGTACYVRGGKKILDRMKEILNIGPGETTPDQKFSLEVMRCIGACGLAPAITVNGKVIKQVNADKLKTLIANL